MQRTASTSGASGTGFATVLGSVRGTSNAPALDTSGAPIVVAGDTASFARVSARSDTIVGRGFTSGGGNGLIPCRDAAGGDSVRKGGAARVTGGASRVGACEHAGSNPLQTLMLTAIAHPRRSIPSPSCTRFWRPPRGRENTGTACRGQGHLHNQ